MNRHTPRPLPRVDVTLGPWIPGTLLRLAAPLTTATLLLLAATPAPLPPDLDWTIRALALALAASAIVRPGHAPALIAVVVTAFLMLATRTPHPANTLWLASLAYVAYRLGTWSATIGWSTRIELTALARATARDAVVLAVTLAVGGVGLLASGRSLPALLTIGTAGLLALAWLALRADHRETR
jgi:hypothetical protein